MPIGTILAHPLHLLSKPWIDDYLAKAIICGCIPLLLQMRLELADIWAPVLWVMFSASLA